MQGTRFAAGAEGLFILTALRSKPPVLPPHDAVDRPQGP